MRFYISILFIFCLGKLNSQIVTIEPTIFSMFETITITYDATKGSGALEGEDNVFMHTGIITEEGGPGVWQNVQGNWGQYDARVLMTNIGNDLHQISITPVSFYGLSGSETVTQLAFVFRNENGSKEGKTSSLGDIFVDVLDPDNFLIGFQNPDEQHLILSSGDQLDIKAFSSAPSTLKLFDNGNLIAEDFGVDLNYMLTVSETGNHKIVLEADNGTENLTKHFSFVVIDGPKEKMDFLFPIKNGITRINENESVLNLYAPNKSNVFVIGDFTNWEIDENFQMTNSLNGDNWWIELNDLEADVYHGYQYIVDGEIKIADPYSELILDDQNDRGIPSELNSVPMDYPFGQTSGHLSIFKTEKDDFNWQHNDFKRPDDTDLVIYEIMMRDFLEDHSYESLKDTLSYLKRLGVNAIELMPISEFENNESWGYNVSYHMALDKYYGSVNSFKELVDAAHGLGIAVFLDVVYNHAFGQCPLVRLYWDKSTGKPQVGGPYFNPDATHLYNVGFDFNHESYATKNYVKQTLEYWIKEFNIDGFRFDLSKGFTQRPGYTDASFSAYDQIRIDILSDYKQYLSQFNPEFKFILEHFADGAEHYTLSELGFMFWDNANHNFSEATMGYNESGKSNLNWIYYKNLGLNAPSMITFMESHDEERLMYKNKTYGNSEGNYNVKNLTTGLDRVEMAACFLMSVPGPKMLFQFGELGNDHSINRCIDGSVSENCRLAPKPIRWDYKDDQNRNDLFEVFRKMIDLKKNYRVIAEGDVMLDLSGALKRLKISHPDGNLVVIGNFDVVDRSIMPEFQHTGRWFDYLNDLAFEVVDLEKPVALAPGEYRVYLDDNRFVTATEELHEVFSRGFNIYPNPAQDFIYVELDAEIHEELEVEIFNIAGNRINQFRSSLPFNYYINEFESGIYFIRFTDSNGLSVNRKFIKH